MIKIKNWSRFQHFKDRNPPWIKLYKEILDDPDWHDLAPRDSKVLMMLWLVASEDRNREGALPCVRKLSFRLRMRESELTTVISRLSGWLIQDDISTISEGYQLDAPETETETETETYCANDSFDVFWAKYPRKKDKAKSRIWWNKNVSSSEYADIIIEGLESQVDEFLKRDQKHVPHPTTWLNGKRWEDEPEPIKPTGSTEVAF